MKYRPFYSLIRRLINQKMSRELFVLEWRDEQKEQKLIGPNKKHVDEVIPFTDRTK